MQAEFWYNSWEMGGTKTSFHLPKVHPYLTKHFPPERLYGKRILVPLCGKTKDMAYFRQYASHVIGVELVEKAVYGFFQEQSLVYTEKNDIFEAERLTIICNDLMELTHADIGPIDLIYDRASLVALPMEMRQRYIRKVNELLPIGAQQFVNTLEYAPDLDEPPFSITPTEIASYYGANHVIDHIEQPSLPQHRMVEKYDLHFLKEHGFLMTKQCV